MTTPTIVYPPHTPAPTVVPPVPATHIVSPDTDAAQAYAKSTLDATKAGGELVADGIERAFAAAGVRHASRNGSNSSGGGAGLWLGIAALVLALTGLVFGFIAFGSGQKANGSVEQLETAHNTAVDTLTAADETEAANRRDGDATEQAARIAADEEEALNRRAADNTEGTERRAADTRLEAQHQADLARIEALAREAQRRADEAANRPIHVTVEGPEQPAPAPTTDNDEFARDIQRATADHYSRTLREGSSAANGPDGMVRAQVAPSSDGGGNSNSGRSGRNPRNR